MPTVYMVDARARDVGHAFIARLEMILEAARLDGLFSPGQQVVITTQVGEVGNTTYLRPVIVRALVEKILSLGSKPLVAESSAFEDGRESGLDWFDVATMHGFASKTLGAEITLSDSYTGAEGELFPTGCGQLSAVKVARIIKEAKALLVVSHVTGHPLTGLGGALVSLGLGCLARDGKARVHQVLKPRVQAEKCDGCGLCLARCRTGAWVARGEDLALTAERCNGCGACLAVCPPRAIAMDAESNVRFQERVAEAAVAAVKAVGGKVCFLNFLLDVGPQPDDYPFSDNPFVPNLGILMSEDPVAIDQASLDLINRAPGLPMSAAEDHGVLEPGRDKVTAIAGVSPLPLIRHAERVGLGRTSYRLMVSA